jgi:hypothetical protein
MEESEARTMVEGIPAATPSTHQGFLKVVCLAMVAALALTVAFCAWHNPFDILPSKDARLVQPRISKAYLAARIRPCTVIIGSSRPELGIPTTHPAWSRPPVLNMAFSGTSATEMSAWFEHCCAVAPVQEALIMLDYASCDKLAEHQHTFDPGRLSTLDRAPLWASRASDLRTAFASRDGLAAAFQCLRTPPAERDFLPLGSRNEKVHYDKILSKGGLRRSFSLTDSRFPRQKTDLAKDWEPLRRMVRVAAQKKVRPVWVITPFHDHLWGLFIRRDGIGEVLGWRRSLVRIIQEEADACGLGRQIFWDFDGSPLTRMSIDEITREASDGRLPLFYEYSHFSTRVGAMMLDRALGNKPGGEPGFGVPVTLDNLEGRIQALHEAWKPLINL